MHDFVKPTLAGLRRCGIGIGIGGGGVAIACDLRIAGSDFVFYVPTSIG